MSFRAFSLIIVIILPTNAQLFSIIYIYIYIWCPDKVETCRQGIYIYIIENNCAFVGRMITIKRSKNLRIFFFRDVVSFLSCYKYVFLWKWSRKCVRRIVASDQRCFFATQYNFSALGCVEAVLNILWLDGWQSK